MIFTFFPQKYKLSWARIAIGFVCGYLYVSAATATAQITYGRDKNPRNFSGLQLYNNDSTFSVNFRFRIQSRLGYLFDQNLHYVSSEYFIRRLRLRFNGFMLTKKLTYGIQLSFSRGDMDWDNTGFPNIIRDAVINYKATKHLTVSIGQTKLPGNRERVVSSAELQMPDRSTANARFNIDRDYGLFFNQEIPLGKSVAYLKGAITSGKGRNVGTNKAGAAYTGRVEWLPMGAFQMEGDYAEGDWVREKTPKLSIAYTYHLNQKALRVGGILGTLLYEPRTMHQQFADLMFKYQGWSVLAEYMSRTTTQNPITTSATDAQKTIAVYNGKGVNTQLSYQWKNHWEIAGRFTQVTPAEAIRRIEPRQTDFSLGVTKYLNYNRLKVQYELTRTNSRNLFTQTSLPSIWLTRFQLELGI